MGWSSTSWTGGGDADSYQVHADDFWEALKERKLLLLSAANYIPITSANLQSSQEDAPESTTGVFSLRYLQDWIVSNCQFFVQSHELTGGIRADDYYDNKATIDMWTFANLITSVRGSAATSFRANADDWSEQDIADTGDALGSWILVDLMECFNRLIWTEHGAFFNKHTLTWTTNFGNGDDPDWEDSKQEAEDDIDSENNLDDEPDCHFWTSGANEQPYAYLTEINKARSFIGVIGVYTSLTCDIDFYMKCTAQDEFEDFSITGVYDDKWGLVSTIPGNTNQEVYSDGPAGPGDLTTPPTDGEWVDEPASGVDSKGFASTGNPKAVLRWNVSGGLQYV